MVFTTNDNFLEDVTHHSFKQVFASQYRKWHPKMIKGNNAWFKHDKMCLHVKNEMLMQYLPV